MAPIVERIKRMVATTVFIAVLPALILISFLMDICEEAKGRAHKR